VSYKLPESETISVVQTSSMNAEKAKEQILSLYSDAIINYVKEV